MLSIDGVQPEKGNEVLYVLREVFSGTILGAISLKSSAAEELAAFIRPITEWGFAIIGVVSDGQPSIRKAMETVLPDVPYQYYQFHCLKDIAKPADLDRQLKTDIKKKLRGIRDIEKKLQDKDDPKSQIAKGYIAAARSVLEEDGCTPLDLPGLRIF